MKKIWLLTKIQLQGIMNPKKVFHMREGKNTSKVMMVFLSLLIVLLFGGMSGMYAYAYATMLGPQNALSAIPAMWMAITSVITLFTTIYKVKGTLFQFSDYDMVMSMPVSTTGIVASRIAVLYIYDLLFTVIIMLPGNVVYGVAASAGASYYLISTLLIFLIPMIPILIGTVLGLVLTIASAKFRFSNYVTLVLFVGLFAAYMIVMMQTATAPDPDAAFVNMANVIWEQVYHLYPLTKMYTLAVTSLDAAALIGFIGITVLAFLVFCYAVGHGFKKLNTLVASSKEKSNYKLKELQTKHVLSSMYHRELKRYFASPMYVLNSAIGMILLTIMCMIYLVAGKDKLAEVIEVPGLLEQLPMFVPIMLLLGVMMTCTTAASISLEGKNLWLLKSLPVSAKQIYLSKAMVNLTITVPLAVLDAFIFAIRLHFNFIQLLVTILLPCAGAAFISFFGLFLNLMFPRFDWKSEMEVVKQGMPTFIAVFGGMLLGVLPFGLCMLLPAIPYEYLFLAFAVILSIITVGIYKYLTTKGSIVFSRL